MYTFLIFQFSRRYLDHSWPSLRPSNYCFHGSAFLRIGMFRALVEHLSPSSTRNTFVSCYIRFGYHQIQKYIYSTSFYVCLSLRIETSPISFRTDLAPAVFFVFRSNVFSAFFYSPFRMRRDAFNFLKIPFREPICVNVCSL